MTVENQDEVNTSGSTQGNRLSQKDVAETLHQTEAKSNADMPGEAFVTVESSEPKTDDKDISDAQSEHTDNQSSAQSGDVRIPSHPSLAQNLDPQPAASKEMSVSTAPNTQDEGPQSGASSAQVTPSEQNFTVGVSPTGGAGSAVTVPSGLAGRLSSLSAAAAASLRDMVASSGAVRDGSDSGKAEKDDGGSEVMRPAETGASPAGETTTDVGETESNTQSGVDDSGVDVSVDIAVKEEPPRKDEPPDSLREQIQEKATTESVSDASVKARESEAFTPTAPFSPETERQESPPPTAESAAPGSSTPFGRGVKIVRDKESPGGRRSSSYLYNDWDRTLYEKTGRPPPGEAHWSRDKSAPRGRSVTHPSGVGACQSTHESTQSAARSPSARRRHSRPATSPHRRRPFDMARCQRETQNSFGRRILEHHCFIEPGFFLRGQRIPVHDVRRGSIIAAEDTYASYALEEVTPPSERQLSEQKVQRRSRVRKKRRRRRRRSSCCKSLMRERLLLEEQWQRLEEENERLEDDRMRLQETRQHLQQLEEWWKTEGLLILQRDELRAEEEKIINAAIEEECIRINEERARIRQEWQFLLERMARQEKEESRIKDEISALDERQEELEQQEETGLRRIHELKAVFDIERRMMEVDRKKLVNEALKCEAFRGALEDAELTGWESLPDETQSRARMVVATTAGPTQSAIDVMLAELKEYLPEPPSADEISPLPAPGSIPHPRASIVAEPVRPPPAPASSMPEQCSPAQSKHDSGPPSVVDSEPPRARRLRPITARGRPVRTSRSSPSSQAVAHHTGRPLSAARSEGAGPAEAAAETGGGETVDIWRRRPTVMERGDLSASGVDLEHAVGGRGRSSSIVPLIPEVISEESVRVETPRAISARERKYAKSEGHIDPNSRRAEVESERRRASATPRLETREMSGSVSQVSQTSPTASVSKTRDAELLVSQDTASDRSEQVIGAPEAVMEKPQSKESGISTPFVAEADAEDVAGSVGDAPEAGPQPTARRSSLRTGEPSQQRRVYFDETDKVKLVSSSDEADGSDGAGQDVDLGDTAEGSG